MGGRGWPSPLGCKGQARPGGAGQPSAGDDREPGSAPMEGQGWVSAAGPGGHTLPARPGPASPGGATPETGAALARGRGYLGLPRGPGDPTDLWVHAQGPAISAGSLAGCGQLRGIVLDPGNPWQRRRRPPACRRRAPKSRGPWTQDPEVGGPGQSPLPTSQLWGATLGASPPWDTDACPGVTGQACPGAPGRPWAVHTLGQTRAGARLVAVHPGVSLSVVKGGLSLPRSGWRGGSEDDAGRDVRKTRAP